MCRANIKKYLTPKVDDIMKLSNCYVTTQIAHAFRTTVQMFMGYIGDSHLKFGARVLRVRTQPLTNSSFFRPKVWISPKYSQII